MVDRQALSPEYSEGLTPYLAAPVILLLVQLVVIAAMPWAECKEGSPTDLSSSAGRHYLIAVTILASLAAGIAAFIRIAAWRRVNDLAGPRWPALWGIATVGLGAAGLIGIPELKGGVGLLAIFGFPAAVIGFFGVLGVSLKRGYAREAGVYLPIYLLASAFAVYPTLAVLALDLSIHPFLCGFD
jgi:hypothetical protein